MPILRLLRRLSLLALLRALLDAAARALSPPVCAACDAEAAEPAALCSACAPSVASLPTPTPTPAPASAPCSLHPPPIVAFAAYRGALAVALRRFKYRARPDLARPLGRLLAQAARRAALGADLVIPVPLHPRRLAERGYNQAALLAAEVAAALGAPLCARGLERLRDTTQQARLDRGARLGNVAEAFRARWPARVRGRAVVLVDDVATTGATLTACGEALLRAGATSVVCLVVARAGADDDDDAANAPDSTDSPQSGPQLRGFPQR